MHPQSPAEFTSRPGRRRASLVMPPLFANVRSQAITPTDVTHAQNTFNEAALYDNIDQGALAWYQREHRAARVLEMCSSTGLCAMRVSRAIKTQNVTLIDIDAAALTIARRRFRTKRLRTVVADAVTHSEPETYDIILLNSAYHHIANRDKAAFLRNVARHLDCQGVVILGDHFLPPYRGISQFRRAVVEFYEPLLSELVDRGTHRRAIEIIRQAAYECWSGVVEFKVSWPVFQAHLRNSGLRLLSTSVVWSPGIASDAGPIGSVVVVLGRDERR
jgi:ubiquinone/menaquinone biosynthesis C-methylase UbiE